MKIISWNCNGKFREKFKDIIEEDADIYVIQECEDPVKAKNDEYKEFAGDNYFWTGNSKDKGLGIFAKEDVALEKISDLNEEDFSNFIALKVNDSFNLLGVWAMPPYVEMIHDFFDVNKSLFDESLICVETLTVIQYGIKSIEQKIMMAILKTKQTLIENWKPVI